MNPRSWRLDNAAVAAFAGRLLWRKKDGRRQHELDVRHFGGHPNTSELAFISAVTRERKQVLVFKMAFDFFEVGFQVYRDA